MKTLHPLGVLLFTALALSVAAPPAAHAQVGPPRRFGLGVAVGFPSVGLSGQYFMTQTRSIQFVASFWYRYGYAGTFCSVGCAASGVFLRGDYLFHPNVFTRGSVAALEWYVGPGVNAGLSGDVQAFGVEGALGLALQFQRAPIDLAIEFVPQLAFVRYDYHSDALRFFFGYAGTFHARYYF